MEMAAIELMKDLSEVVRYEREGVRLSVREARLSAYPGLRAPCHWHDDLECIHILDGVMGYSINGQEIVLRTGDSLIVNARQIHAGHDCGGQDCHFLCILFHPSLFTGSEALLQKEVLPVLEHPALSYWHFSGTDGMGQAAAEILRRIAALKASAQAGYELEVTGLLHILWGRLRRQAGELPPVPGAPYTDLELQKDMVSYIYQNYGKKLTLEEIAASGRMSRSKCCQLFRRYLQQSPIDFLNAYRLKVCCNLLESTGLSITEIALSCGFNHLSYFSKLFLDRFGCTPREYRKRRRGAGMPDPAAPAGETGG